MALWLPAPHLSRVWTCCLLAIMSGSMNKLTRILDKIAVDNEPGLTNAQLMLVNHDLKPGAYQNLELL